MQRLRTILFSVGLTLVCGVYGGWGVLQRVQFSAPVSVRCAPREFEGRIWVRVSLCEYKPATLKQGDDGTEVMVEHLNGLDTVPFLVHSSDPKFIDAAQPGALLAPFYAQVVDGPRVRLEASSEAPTSPSLIWPIVSLVAALFWLVVTVGGLLPRKSLGS